VDQNSPETCPVCESDLSKQIEECPECGVFIDLFDVDVDLNSEIPKRSIEKVKEMIIEEGEDEELIEAIKEIEFEGEQSEEDVEEIVTFACPICESEVGEDDAECPNCGAIFEVEEEESEEETSSIELDIENELKSFEKRVGRFERLGLDMRYPKSDIEEYKNSAEEGERERCEELSVKIEDQLDYAEKISRYTDKMEHLLDVASEDTDISELEDSLSKVYKGCEIGEFQIALKKAKEIEENFEKHIEDQVDQGWLDEFLEEKNEEIESKISGIEADIDIKDIKERLEDAEAAKSEGEMAEAVHKTMSTMESVSIISNVSEKIVKAMDIIERLEIEEYVSESSHKVDDLIEKIEMGEIYEAKNMADGLIPSLEEKLEKQEKKEEEKKKMQEEEIDEKISEARSLLESAQGFELEIDEGLLDDALELREKEEYEDGISKLDDLKDSYVEEFEEKIRAKIDGLRDEFDETLFVEEFSEEEVEDLIDDHDFERALNLIQEKKDRMEELQKQKEKLTDDIERLDKIIDDAETIDFEIEEVKKTFEKAEENIAAIRCGEAEKNINYCERQLQQKLVKFLQGEIKNAKKKLRNADDGTIDIKETIGYLKEANRAKKDKRIGECFDALKKYKREIERI